jgi:hypothetical protein
MYIYREIMNTDYLLSVNDFYMQFSQNALLWFHILYIFLHKNTIYVLFHMFLTSITKYLWCKWTWWGLS